MPFPRRPFFTPIFEIWTTFGSLKYGEYFFSANKYPLISSPSSATMLSSCHLPELPKTPIAQTHRPARQNTRREYLYDTGEPPGTTPKLEVNQPSQTFVSSKSSFPPKIIKYPNLKSSYISFTTDIKSPAAKKINLKYLQPFQETTAAPTFVLTYMFYYTKLQTRIK